MFTSVPVTAPEGSAAAGDVSRAAGSAPAPRPTLLQSLLSPRGLLYLALGIAGIAAVAWLGLSGGSAPSPAGAGAGAPGGGAGGAGGKDAKAGSKAPKSPSKSPRPKPSASPTSSPDSPCTCDPGEDKGGRTILHLLSADSPEGIAMGNTGGGSTENNFLLHNVMDVVSKDPNYPNGRTVVLYRPRGPFTAPVGQNFGHEINQATFPTIAGTGIFSDVVLGQKCAGTAPPAFLYIDTANDADAGAWFAESAPNLVDRWAQALKAHPTATLLLKAPATHKSAMLQLLGVPSDRVAYVNKGGIPCDKGNTMYIPPMGQQSLPGWSQSWWKSPHLASLTLAARKAAGLPACPAKPPTVEAGVGIVLVARSEAERLEAKGKGSDYEDAMGTWVSGLGGKVVKLPESLALADSGSEMREFVEALGTARVLLLPPTSSFGFYANLARGATILLEGGKSPEGVKLLAVPGHKTELGAARTSNIVELVAADKGKGEDVAAAQAIVQAVIDGKEKAKMPKCTAPK